MNKLAYEKCPGCGMPKLSCRGTPACYRAVKKAQYAFEYANVKWIIDEAAAIALEKDPSIPQDMAKMQAEEILRDRYPEDIKAQILANMIVEGWQDAVEGVIAKKAQGNTTRLGQWGIIYGMPQEIQKTVNDLDVAAVKDAEGRELFPIELVNRLLELAESLSRYLGYRN